MATEVDEQLLPKSEPKKNEERKKRPEVQRYKPGAFSSRRKDVATNENNGALETMNQVKLNEGRENTVSKEQGLTQKKARKPEIEHYVPKKVGEKLLSKEGNGLKSGEELLSGGGGSGRKTRKKTPIKSSSVQGSSKVMSHKSSESMNSEIKESSDDPQEHVSAENMKDGSKGTDRETTMPRYRQGVIKCTKAENRDEPKSISDEGARSVKNSANRDRRLRSSATKEEQKRSVRNEDVDASFVDDGLPSDRTNGKLLDPQDKNTKGKPHKRKDVKARPRERRDERYFARSTEKDMAEIDRAEIRRLARASSDISEKFEGTRDFTERRLREASPPRSTRIYRRQTSPLMSTSPHGKHPQKNSHKKQKDLRDLDGWSRGDPKRKDNRLWDPNSPPVASRPNPISISGKTEPPTTWGRRGARMNSESSVISDWSLEVEEEETAAVEEERRQLEMKTFQEPHRFNALSGPGIIRLTGSGTTVNYDGECIKSNSSGQAKAHQPRRPGYAGEPQAQSHFIDLNHVTPRPKLSDTGGRALFDPNSPEERKAPNRATGTRLPQDHFRQNSPLDPYQLPPSIQFPLETSRFVACNQVQNNRLGNGYRPPFSQSRRPLAQPPPPPYLQGYLPTPDWYDVFDQNVYGRSKVDINFIARIVKSDNNLRQLLAGGPDTLCSEWDDKLKASRQEIMATTRDLMKNDIFFMAERDVDTHIWKTIFYQIVDMMKAACQDTESKSLHQRDIYRNNILSLVEEGTEFYHSLLTDLENDFHLNIKRFCDPLEPRGSGKHVRIALILAQKYFLCLGDLARYSEEVKASNNYGRAKQYYQKANHIDMRNGRPFHMLGILARFCHRKFEAVYYNVRCLSCHSQNKVKFQASKEALTVLFEEVKRRWESVEKQKLDRQEELERTKDSNQLIRGSRVRREIWTRPEGGRRIHRTTSANAERDNDQELDTLSVTDLNKRFINTYLHVQGIMFTQINTDDLGRAVDSLLSQFRTLIGKSPLMLETDRLVQIMALNMYSIEETKLRSSAAAADFRTVLQTKALEVAGDMFAILLERCNVELASRDNNFFLNPDSAQEDDLSTLLAGVKVWCDWIIGNNDTWYPVVSAEPFSQLAQLATKLEAVKSITADLIGSFLNDEAWKALPQAGREEFDLVRLPEDSILCEFEPWFRGFTWPSYRHFRPKVVNPLCAQNAKRIDQIRMCVEYLEGLEPPVLKWSVLDNSHICLVTDRVVFDNESETADIAEATLSAMLARDEDILEESFSESDGESELPSGDDFDLSDEIARLRIRKQELEKMRKRETHIAQREILAKHVSTTLEVVPKILVPDTNAFIDHLELLKDISKSGEFQIRIPVVVLGELEGLGKTRDSHQTRPEHSATVRENSKLALAWIRGRQPNVKCVTTKGSVLASFSLTCEEDSWDGLNNDDKILACCLSLDTAPPSHIEDGMKTVYRNTVLLTDDRNLKLKAHIQDCAVSRLKDFVAWISGEH